MGRHDAIDQICGNPNCLGNCEICVSYYDDMYIGPDGHDYSAPAPDKLPFRPWWYHPNHNYVGKHRGTYDYDKTYYKFQRVPEGTVPSYFTALPYGVRNIKITPYIDANDVSIGLDTWSPKLVATHPFRRLLRRLLRRSKG